MRCYLSKIPPLINSISYCFAGSNFINAKSKQTGMKFTLTLNKISDIQSPEKMLLLLTKRKHQLNIDSMSNILLQYRRRQFENKQLLDLILRELDFLLKKELQTRNFDKRSISKIVNELGSLEELSLNEQILKIDFEKMWKYGNNLDKMMCLNGLMRLGIAKQIINKAEPSPRTLQVLIVQIAAKQFMPDQILSIWTNYINKVQRTVQQTRFLSNHMAKLIQYSQVTAFRDIISLIIIFNSNAQIQNTQSIIGVLSNKLLRLTEINFHLKRCQLPLFSRFLYVLAIALSLKAPQPYSIELMTQLAKWVKDYLPDMYLRIITTKIHRHNQVVESFKDFNKIEFYLAKMNLLHSEEKMETLKVIYMTQLISFENIFLRKSYTPEKVEYFLHQYFHIIEKAILMKKEYPNDQKQIQRRALSVTNLVLTKFSSLLKEDKNLFCKMDNIQFLVLMKGLSVVICDLNLTIEALTAEMILGLQLEFGRRKFECAWDLERCYDYAQRMKLPIPAELALPIQQQIVANKMARLIQTMTPN